MTDPVSPRPKNVGLPDHPKCPFCNGTETELYSAFGTAATVASYWCRHCRTAFEHIKWRGAHAKTPPDNG